MNYEIVNYFSKKMGNISEFKCQECLFKENEMIEEVFLSREKNGSGKYFLNKEKNTRNFFNNVQLENFNYQSTSFQTKVKQNNPKEFIFINEKENDNMNDNNNVNKYKSKSKKKKDEVKITLIYHNVVNIDRNNTKNDNDEKNSKIYIDDNNNSSYINNYEKESIIIPYMKKSSNTKKAKLKMKYKKRITLNEIIEQKIECNIVDIKNLPYNLKFNQENFGDYEADL